MRPRLRPDLAQHGGRRRPAARERPDAELVLGLAHVHEAMHKLAHAGCYPFWERTFNVTDHDYGAELACAKKLLAATSFDAVAKAYFQNDAVLRDTLVARLRIDLGALRREINAETLCARL